MTTKPRHAHPTHTLQINDCVVKFSTIYIYIQLMYHLMGNRTSTKHTCEVINIKYVPYAVATT